MDQKPQEKVPFTTAVQKALEDAAKSCQRELTTMVALGPSSIPPPQPPSEYAVSPSVDHEIRGTVRRFQVGDATLSPPLTPNHPLLAFAPLCSHTNMQFL